MASLQSTGKGVIRTVKNYTKGYSDVQTKVRESTSNDPWGPSGTQMNEIAQYTYNQQDFVEVMEMLDKRLNDKGKNWRHVFKSLTVLDYILHAGSENVVLYFKENIYIVKTLKEFVYVDEDGKDQGLNVRQKAKDITSLLQDDSRMKEARKSRAHMRDRLSGGKSTDPYESSNTHQMDDFGPSSRRRGSAPPVNNNRRSNKEDDDLRRAIEESKRMAENDTGRSRPAANNGDADLEEALRLSKEEDEKRKRTMEGRSALFDDQQENSNQLIDFNQPQQPQQTGMMPQFTGMPQFNSFNPYAAAQQQAQQEEYMRMQQQYEMQRQMEEQAQLQQQQAMMQQQYMLQQQQQMQQQMQQQQMQPQMLVPQPTAFGSNNPFASFSSPSPQPALQSQFTGFQPTQQPVAAPAFKPASPAPQRETTPLAQNKTNNADAQHANLVQALAQGSGIDSFGNEGNLRFGQGRVQNNSPFHPSNRTNMALQPNPTGSTNPFGSANGFGNNFNGSAQPQQQQQQPFFQL